MKPTTVSWEHWNTNSPALKLKSNNNKHIISSARSSSTANGGGGMKQQIQYTKVMGNTPQHRKSSYINFSNRNITLPNNTATTTTNAIETTLGKQMSSLAFVHAPVVRRRYVFSHSGLINRHLKGPSQSSVDNTLQRHVSNSNSNVIGIGDRSIYTSQHKFTMTMTEKVIPRVGYSIIREAGLRPPAVTETTEDTYSDIVARSIAKEKELKLLYMKSNDAVSYYTIVC